MHPKDHFHFCPACGVALPGGRASQPLHCDACGFHYYFNTTCATGAFLVRPDGAVLFIRREKDPARGMLAIPGGFIDEGETAETGIRREFREEVGIEPGELTFLCSHPNRYAYRGLTYSVLDFFFIARAAGDETPAALDAVESVHWLDPVTVNPDDIAFPSMRYALARYLETLAGG